MTVSHTRLTLEDIAKEIHISRTTIYKVLNNKGTVSEKTKETILQALEKYHYVPNSNARNLALNKQYRIALIDFESPDADYFAASIERGIQQAVRDYGDHGLSVESFTSPISNPLQQRLDIHTAFDTGIRHFIISAADSSIIRPELDWLAEEGCSVVLLSKDLPDAPYDAFIGIDEYKSGRLAGELMGKLMPDGGKLQILMARDSTSNISTSQIRLQGFLDKIREFPAIEILPVIRDLSGSEKIQSMLLQILADKQISGIFDLTYHLGLISDVLHRSGQESVKLVGIDLFPQIAPYIMDQTIDAVIFQNLEAQTYLACRLLFEKVCYNQTIRQKKHYSKLEIVMKENLEYFIPDSEI